MAVTYDGANVTVWLNGVSDGATAVAKTPYHIYNSAVNYVYVASRALDKPWNGELAELRLSTKARYTATFTPPVRHQNDEYTGMLLHGDEGPSSTLAYTFSVYFNGRLRLDQSGPSLAAFASTSVVPKDRWTHVAVSCDGSTCRFFIDGVLDGSSASSGNYSDPANPP